MVLQYYFTTTGATKCIAQGQKRQLWKIWVNNLHKSVAKYRISATKQISHVHYIRWMHSCAFIWCNERGRLLSISAQCRAFPGTSVGIRLKAEGSIEMIWHVIPVIIWGKLQGCLTVISRSRQTKSSGTIFIQYWKFRSSQIYELVDVFETPPVSAESITSGRFPSREKKTVIYFGRFVYRPGLNRYAMNDVILFCLFGTFANK